MSPFQEHGGVPRNDKTKTHDGNLGLKGDNKSKRKCNRRKNNKVKQLTLKFLGNNVGGILNKLESLENIIKTEIQRQYFNKKLKWVDQGGLKFQVIKHFHGLKWYKPIQQTRG